MHLSLIHICKETYSKAYNEFSQFIAANNTLEKMIANAEDAGYKLLDRADLYSSEPVSYTHLQPSFLLPIK